MPILKQTIIKVWHNDTISSEVQLTHLLSYYGILPKYT